jgi:hypothetical protein
LQQGRRRCGGQQKRENERSRPARRLRHELQCGAGSTENADETTDE